MYITFNEISIHPQKLLPLVFTTIKIPTTSPISKINARAIKTIKIIRCALSENCLFGTK